jgi:hypothetical protein
MNNCEHYETLLSTWTDDGLERPEQVECLDHIVPADAESPSPEVWKRIQWVTTKERRKQPARRRIPLWAMQAAAVVVIAVGLSVVVWNGTATAPDQAEVRLGSSTKMTEGRFVELTKEVLEADARYHSAMYQIMGQVVRDTSVAGEASLEDVIQRSDEVDSGENAESVGRVPA